MAVALAPAESSLSACKAVLSFGIPFALVPLVMLTCPRDVMGIHVNRRLTTVLAWSCAILICALNIFLIYQQFFSG
jgi:manganese transport protein